MFLTYSVITTKSKVIQKSTVCFVNDNGTVSSFISSKIPTSIEVVEVLLGKSFNPVDLTSLDLVSLEDSTFKDLKIIYPKLFLKLVLK